MLKRKHFKNYILCGELDNYCLLCKKNVKIKENHLQRSLHKMKVTKTDTRMPQFIKDGIRKVEIHYYCSFCNITIQDVPQIKVHIISDTHINYKARPEAALARVEVTNCYNDFTIDPKSTKTVVTHLQWNGIIDKKCVLCNVVVSNVAGHIYGGDHVIKLVQTRINCVGDNYYRKTVWNTFQCFNCKLAYPMDIFDAHFMNHSNNNTTVKTNPKISKWNLEKLEPIFGKPLIGCCASDENDVYPKVLCSMCMDVISKFEWDIELFAGLEDDYLEIDENKILKCKECQKVLKTSAHGISDHLYTHFSYHTIYSNFRMAINNYADRLYVPRSINHGAARSKAAQYAKINYIKMNAGGSVGYCTLCDKVLSASIEGFKKHVGGSYHRGHLELKGIKKPEKHKRGTYKSILTHDLITTLAYSADKRSFLVNETILMYEDSFFLMKRIQHGSDYNKTKCFACDETIMPEDEKEHCISWKHKSKMLTAQSLDAKLYMREIRPRLYHCGLCNATLPYWENLEKHSKKFYHHRKVNEIASGDAVSELVKKFGFSRKIILKTNIDNIYMQLLNAVFNTKYVIKFDE